ncbi:dTDP-4-amino-4,6-dideoxygalactose transaminase [Alienimonas chondri]|uniref:dTDP-4-amino-4,6-dideoxygalactose transaminase n=1 Tax=Alienimonas chondri TaxID=2681879 RepID=A0ABX1VGN1_9PLAN|nr:dTDP-4-amino-4,6-dideoxygalactose transaminase [Alienimonas chondri]NNJ26944.1 dTDP-4-amino-4,6-dideoxygalactose transaminase [Alienimonas chondri]
MNETQIPFNKPFVAGKELYYVAQAVTRGNLGGDGYYTKACCRLLEDKFGIPKVLLTPSCTASLEMAAILCELEEGDEVIMPSYTFVSTASAFVREGATPVFVDIRPDTLNIDENLIEAAVTDKTKAICVVHYAGVGCEMDRIVATAKKHDLILIEDAAQGVNAFYKGRALGTIGDLGCYSFHETKNIICGEGGALCINNPRFNDRAEIIRDKGTNRRQFFRGEVDKYTWVDVGSSFVPSEICSAFLYGQLKAMESITDRRGEVYREYRDLLQSPSLTGEATLPTIPEDCDCNFHMFYLIASSNGQRDALIQRCRDRGIDAVFHYIPLHCSPMGRQFSHKHSLPVTEDLSSRLVRLPLFHDISREEQALVAEEVLTFLDSSDGGSDD